MKNKKTIVLSVLALITLFLLFYAGDKEYLQEKSADKVWVDLSGTINQIVGKGDLVIYDAPKDLLANSDWIKYVERFTYHIEQLNKKNEPRIKNQYIFSTSFHKVDGRVAINFIISEKNTDQVVESKEVIVDPIKYTSIIPAVVALFLCFATSSPIMSLVVSMFLGSILYNGGSVIMGSKELFYNYLPYGFYGNNVNIFCFLIIINIFLRILSGAGGFDSLKRTKGPLKYLLLPMLSFHPYAGVTAGAWVQQSFKNSGLNKLRSSFIAHLSTIIISSLFIYSYSNIGVTVFVESLQYRFFSITSIAMLIFFMISNKNKDKELDSDNGPQELDSKKMIKIRSYMPFMFLMLFTVLFGLMSIMIGMIRLDVVGEEILKLSRLKHYLVVSNVSSALVLSSLLSLILLVIHVIRTRLLNTKDILEYTRSGLKSSAYFAIVLLLSFSFSKVLTDMGSAYYIISLFKVKIGTPFFPFVCFIISTATSLMLGNGLLSSTIITPILLPIAGQIGGDLSTASVVAAILEGYIAGELLSPYSPTTIMVSNIFKLNPAKHSAYAFPFVGLAIIAASLIGFMLSGTNLPIWVSYVAIFMFSALVILKKPVK